MPVTVRVHKAPEPPGIGPWVGLSFTCLAHLELGLRQSGRGDLRTTSTSPHRQFVNHSSLLVGSFNVCSCYLRIYWPCFPCAAATWKSARLHCSDSCTRISGKVSASFVWFKTSDCETKIRADSSCILCLRLLLALYCLVILKHSCLITYGDDKYINLCVLYLHYRGLLASFWQESCWLGHKYCQGVAISTWPELLISQLLNLSELHFLC